MTDQPLPDERRVLGHQRIFQSVFNDLKMRHEIVTTADGRQQYAYVYDGVDPYELEDSAFPGTVKALQAYTNRAVLSVLERVERELPKNRTHTEGMGGTGIKSTTYEIANTPEELCYNQALTDVRTALSKISKEYLGGDK